MKWTKKMDYVSQQYGRALVKKMTFHWKEKKLVDRIKVYSLYYFWRIRWVIKKQLQR